LVDIGIRALSPAVNDPTTAVQVLDRLHGLLRAVAGRPDPSGCFLDSSGTVRLIVPLPGWDQLVQLAFTEIALYGAGDPQISRKLNSIYEDLAACVSQDRGAPLTVQREWLRNEVPRRNTLGVDRVMAPDVLGLG
jgi:uncharacterized membrane protein